MIDLERRFDDALTAFSQSGNRWEGVKHLTYWGAARGMSADDVIAAAHGVGVPSRDADIRRGMVSAVEKIRANAARFGNRPTGGTRYRPTRQKPAEPMPQPNYVRQLIEAGQDVETDDALRSMSPAKICADTDPLALKVMGEIQLVRMFDRTDMVRIRKTKDDNSRSVPAVNLKPTGDWLTAGVHPVEYGEIVRINPLTGTEGLTRDNRPSFDAQSCVAEFRHIVMEFDDLPRDDQRRFWAGFIRKAPMAANLICLVDSGGKSIHGVLRVDAPDEATWMRYKAKLLTMYATDTDKRYHLDDQAMMPLTGCRLAGARRAETGKIQTLLWACDEWRDQAWFLELNPPTETPAPCQQPPAIPQDTFAAHCRSCQEIDNCKHTFGRFWRDKSADGVGCNSPLHYDKT